MRKNDLTRLSLVCMVSLGTWSPRPLQNRHCDRQCLLQRNTRQKNMSHIPLLLPVPPTSNHVVPQYVELLVPVGCTNAVLVSKKTHVQTAQRKLCFNTCMITFIASTSSISNTKAMPLKGFGSASMPNLCKSTVSLWECHPAVADPVLRSDFRYRLYRNPTIKPLLTSP